MKDYNDFMVCVKCATYNQSAYIEDALNGFCMQKTNFPYVCVIIDDASTDGEQQVLNDYMHTYFDTGSILNSKDRETTDYILKVGQHKINKNCFFAVVFLKENHFKTDKTKTRYYAEWQNHSKYIAMCEGDDYWIDSHKLQRQVDFLESHPEYVMCFHNAIIRYQKHDKPDMIMREFESGDFDTLRLFQKWQLPLASVLFRKEVYEQPILTELNKVFPGGYCLFITATKIGKVFGISECLSVYRKNDGGISNQMHSSTFLYNHLGFAKITGDITVIRYEEKKAVDKVIGAIPRCMIGKEEAKKIIKVAKEHNKKIIYKAILLLPFKLPGMLVQRLLNRK